MSDTTTKNGDTFIVNTDDADLVGRSIVSDANELLHSVDAKDQYNLEDFQKKFTSKIQPNFPDALQGVLGTFIQNQYNGYQDILLNRVTIGFLLQNKVAADSEVTDNMTKQQFQEQLTNIQQGW